MMTEDYSRSIAFTGSASKALDVARSLFLQLGFQIVSSTPTGLQVKGPGLNSTRQNPLLGVSEASITVHNSTIEIKAAMGGVERLRKFLLYFPAAMAVFFLALFGALWLTLPSFSNPIILLIPVLTLSPWIFIAPMMARMLKRRTEKAIDTLLTNMAVLAKGD